MSLASAQLAIWFYSHTGKNFDAESMDWLVIPYPDNCVSWRTLRQSKNCHSVKKSHIGIFGTMFMQWMTGSCYGILEARMEM